MTRIQVRWLRMGGQNSDFVARVYVNGVPLALDYPFIRKSSQDYEEPYTFTSVTRYEKDDLIEVRFEDRGDGSLVIGANSRIQAMLTRGN